MNDFPKNILARPFGAESRGWMLDRYFEAYPEVSVEDAWKHLYRLLLWVDQTTALAHCYESDKAQPGRHWYQRSLAFHKWLADHLGCSPRALHHELDFLFKLGTKILAVSTARQQARQMLRAEKQREPFAEFDMPEAGEDPELEIQISTVLEEYFGATPPPGLVTEILNLVRSRIRLENKRKNLVGEGFEDALGAVLSRVQGASEWDVHCRKVLHDLPGFREPPKREKQRTVDLAVIQKATGQRALASVKWSVRADREEQFAVDFEAYARNESSGRGFDFVFVTNEFDAARLVSACERRHMARQLFSHVVHVNPHGLLEVYGDDAERSAARLVEYIKNGRLISLADWIGYLQSSAPS